MSEIRFQSPRTGKFESNGPLTWKELSTAAAFQSPRTGKFELNEIDLDKDNK